MKMKHAATGLALLVLFTWAAPGAAQQQPEATRADSVRADVEQIVEQSGVVPALEQLATVAGPELERALDQLATTLGTLATRIAEDPELRTSAVRAARGMADVAAALVVEQADALQEALRTAADRLEAMAGAREPRN
jgi:hypothetical protein